MKILTRIKTIMILIVSIAILIGVWWVASEIKKTKVEVVKSTAIDRTPEVVQSIKNIGEWEFLSIADEEIVDTIRKGLLTDDHLVRIYYGRLRLGINMHQCGPRWIETRGDTVTVHLPHVTLLDKDFIDETRTKSFYESGRWTAADREAMYRQAYHKMTANCLTPKNISKAEANAETQMRNIMLHMGFKQVKIVFE
ncbi:MAG: DUF4230 domain-containing protein [Prevotella sp.]|nr:DUF4230 domain-containing protein [Prevotella sp.]